MTEEEAKTKWCPFVRHAYTPMQFETNPTAISINRCVEKDKQAEGCSCIGSQCMAWRWILAPQQTVSFNEESANPKAGSYVAIGYCGLVGRK